MTLMLYLTEVYKYGSANAGDVLFTSETNVLDVFFESDSTVTFPGFTLDVGTTTACSTGMY